MISRRWWIAAAALLVVVVIAAVSVGGGTAERVTPAPLAPGYVRSSSVHKVPLPRALRGKRMKIWARGSWCWFGDPRAVRVLGKRDETFVGWIGWRGQITIGAYDARLGFLGTHVIGRVAVDDHGAPSILIEASGRVTVFWSGHNGPTMNYRTSQRPFDLRTWAPLRHVNSQLRGPRGFTYPNPTILSAEHDKLYLFWRGADWSQDFATRTIGGRWSNAKRLIAVPHERPYVKVASNGTNTIALAFTNGHPRGVITSVYYAAYRDGALWSADRRRITTLGHGPISPGQADLVYDGNGSGVRAWVWDVALSASARPVIVYATFPRPRHHLYWYATWNGQRWVSHLISVGGPSITPHTIEKQYSGGLALDHANPSIVYLSRRVGRAFEIERWKTLDAGYSWGYSTIARSRGVDSVRPVVPRGPDGRRIELLWLRGQYRGYRRYHTSIAFLR